MGLRLPSRGDPIRYLHTRISFYTYIYRKKIDMGIDVDIDVM